MIQLHLKLPEENNEPILRVNPQYILWYYQTPAKSKRHPDDPVTNVTVLRLKGYDQYINIRETPEEIDAMLGSMVDSSYN